MSSTAPTIIFLSAEDLDQLRVCIKSRALQEKLSAVNYPHGTTLMTVSLNPTQRLLSMFGGDAKEKLSLHLKNPTQSVNFSKIQSIPLKKRDERREVHNLIRQLSKGKLDSGPDNETSRINVYVRSSTTQYHKQENQRLRLPRQPNTQQQRAPVRASLYRNTKNDHNTASRNKLATRGVAPRASPTAPLAGTAQPTAQNEGAAAEARAERRDAPVPETEHIELHRARVEQSYTFTGKQQEPELTPEEIAERAERRKNAVPPHIRGTASQSKKDE
jgi:hypothetical protein